jgi:hypothetical protein
MPPPLAEKMQRTSTVQKQKREPPKVLEGIGEDERLRESFSDVKSVTCLKKPVCAFSSINNSKATGLAAANQFIAAPGVPA